MPRFLQQVRGNSILITQKSLVVQIARGYHTQHCKTKLTNL
jgi:hypothetical protein